MNALRTLNEKGFQVEADGDRLIVSPREQLNDDLRAFIRQRKAEIIEALRGPANDPPLFVYYFRLDGSLVTTHSDLEPREFVLAMLERFGHDRRISVDSHWPIRN